LFIASDDREGVMVYPDRSTATFSKIVMAKPPVVERSRNNRIFQQMKRILPRFYLVGEAW
jgi:hypothetical protein